MATDTISLLDTYHFNILKDMAVLLSVVPQDQGGEPNRSKRAHIGALSPFLFTRQAVHVGLEKLGKRERDTLAAIQRAGGRISVSRLKQLLLRQRLIQLQERSQYFSGYGSTNVHLSEQYRVSFEHVIGRLIASGLVCAEGISETGYSNRSKIYYDNPHTVYIPQEIQHLLPEAPDLVVHTFKPENLTRIEENSARAFQRDIYLYWSTVRAEPLSLTNDLRLYKKDLKRVNAALQRPEELGYKDEPDLPRLIFMRRLMISIGILKQSGKTVEAVEQPKFLSQNPTTRVQRTLKQWRDDHFWNEVLSIPNFRAYSMGTRLNDVPAQISQARATVIDHIIALHNDERQSSSTARTRGGSPEHHSDRVSAVEWHSLDALVDSLRMGDYGFLLPRDYKPRYAYYYSYTRRTPYSSYGNAMNWDFNLTVSDEAEGWEYIEANFIRTILLEPMSWMGLVDIGYIDDQPEAYRLTAMGAWVLGIGGEIDIPEGEGKVVVQPNYEIYAMDPISDVALARLDEFADRVSTERAIQYILSRESVYRAQKRGWTATRIIDTLHKMSDHALPQNVTRTLHEWQMLHERITIRRQATILQAVDAKLLDGLAETATVNSYILSRPADTVVIVDPEPNAASELLGALQEMGHLPARTRALRDVLRPCLTISQDGQIHFREALPSIYLFRQIAPFTNQDGESRYFLTESAVKSALAGINHPSSAPGSSGGDSSNATAANAGGTQPATAYTVDKILEILRVLHIGPLPRWIEIQVRAWGNYYGNAVIQPLILVQIRDAQTLRELMQEPELQGLLQIFAPDQQKTLAVVKPENLDQLRQAFAERGIQISDQLE